MGNCPTHSSITMDNVTLLIIDPQNDFHSGGSLAVPGADEDAVRISNFIRNNLDKIENIVVTKDTHNVDHIAHAVFWNSKEDGTGVQPSIFSRISYDDVKNGLWFPKDSSKKDYCVNYCKALEEKGRFQLTIWPPHCLIGTPGHDIVPIIQEALDVWTTKTGKKIVTVEKGMNNYTEMYSAIEAEVPIASDPQTQTNKTLVRHLQDSTKVVVCGQAMSHCVNYTTRDILRDWDPRNTSDIIILTDGASPVVGCEKDSTKFLEEMKNSGLSMTTTSKLFL